MSATEPTPLALLRDIAAGVELLIQIATDPAGRVQTAQTDTLKIYGITGFSGEVLGIQRDQILALTEAIAVLVGRFIEHDRRVVTAHDAMLAALHELAEHVGATAIAENAIAARQQLEAEAEARDAETAAVAAAAAALLESATMQQLEVVKRFVEHEKDAILQAGAAEREAIQHEKESE